MMEFEKLTWRMRREMAGNRKPILLFFGNGYDSQILLLALHKLRKKFMIIHVTREVLGKKVRNVLSKFGKHHKLILRPYRDNEGYKTFANNNAICAEDLNVGFSPLDYLIVAGFKLTEPTLVKAYHKGLFEDMYCPLLRFHDGWIERLYRDMKKTESLGGFLHENLTSDSHHNIEVN